MKTLNIILVATTILISTSALAQTNNSRSKKEQMKMEVVKMNTTPAKIVNSPTAINRSAKEQMKLDQMKSAGNEQAHELVFDNLGNCPNQLAVPYLSSKEQMKHKVVNQSKCVIANDTATVKTGKCNMCGKTATVGKK